MKSFDDETRRRLATGWDPRVSTAREYAQVVGVSERALRLWRARFGGDQQCDVPHRHGGMPLGGDGDQLRARLAELDDLLAAAHRAAAACRAALDAACRSMPGGMNTAAVQHEGMKEHDGIRRAEPPDTVRHGAPPSARVASAEAAGGGGTGDGTQVSVDAVQGGGGAAQEARRARVAKFYDDLLAID